MHAIFSLWQALRPHSSSAPSATSQPRPCSPVMASNSSNIQITPNDHPASTSQPRPPSPPMTASTTRSTLLQEPAPPQISPTPTTKAHQTHLVLCVNGLFGSPANWAVISKLLREHLDSQTTLIHVSAANQFNQTFDGIDVCGTRLAAELQRVVREHPNLERLSIVAHSMGGLISRYAIGKLYDPQTKRIAGLYPTHFVAMAVPHVGVSNALGVGEVPMIKWMDKVPGIGGGIQRLAQTIAPSVAKISFSRSGQQFFLEDKDSSGHPLLYRLARDCSPEGLFFSALSAFETRTVYANKSGDYLVNWAQSSVRSVDELPELSTRGKGVVREDPLVWAWPVEVRTRLQGQAAAQELHVEESLTSRAVDIMEAGSPEELVARDIAAGGAITNETRADSASSSLLTQQSLEATTATTSEVEADRDAYLESNLRQLQKLSWRRVDVCFGAAALPILAHQHLQVQRHWLNWEGMATAKHLALQLVAMEGLRATAGLGPGSVRRDG